MCCAGGTTTSTALLIAGGAALPSAPQRPAAPRSPPPSPLRSLPLPQVLEHEPVHVLVLDELRGGRGAHRSRAAPPRLPSAGPERCRSGAVAGSPRGGCRDGLYECCVACSQARHRNSSLGNGKPLINRVDGLWLPATQPSAESWGLPGGWVQEGESDWSPWAGITCLFWAAPLGRLVPPLQYPLHGRLNCGRWVRKMREAGQDRVRAPWQGGEGGRGGRLRGGAPSAPWRPGGGAPGGAESNPKLVCALPCLGMLRTLYETMARGVQGRAAAAGGHGSGSPARCRRRGGAALAGALLGRRRVRGGPVSPPASE